MAEKEDGKSKGVKTIYTRAYREESGQSSAAGAPIRFVASTENMARDGMTIQADAWQLDNFAKNPVFLWAHQYDQPPIGRADVTQEEGALVASVTFDQGDELAKAIERKYREGFLHSVSVGWETQQNEGATITRAELLDVSAVPVPGDPDALIQRQWDSVRQSGLRVGAVLNVRNRDALEQAVELIRTVLKSAKKPSADEEADEDEEERAYRAILAKLTEVQHG